MKHFIKCNKPKIFILSIQAPLKQCFHEIAFIVENQFLDYLEKEHKTLMSKMIFGIKMNNLASRATLQSKRLSEWAF